MTPIPDKLQGEKILSDALLDQRRYQQAEAEGVDRRQPIKNCPFCGNQPEPWPIAQGYGFAVECPTCEYPGPWGDSRELAIYAWNTRAK